jgi:mannose/fructose/N-acetylgalactosamine-specific phosphotransferase system component IIB
VTLVLNRIDDRLIHGQVVVGWGQPFDIGFIVLVNDEVADSDWEQELYRMGTPPEMDLYFHSVQAAISALDGYRADERSGILLTGDVASMRRLVAEAGVREVNIGGIHHRPDRRQKLRYVFLSPVEEEVLKEMETLGAHVSARDVPAATPIDLKDVLTADEAAR